MSSVKENLMTALKGVAMGAANVIPGVSGGTIALMTGIFTRLIESIKSFDGKALKLIFTGRWAEFWKKVDGTFLTMVIIGVLVSTLTFAKLMQYLMEVSPVALWSFFFGLIVASAIYVLRDVPKWSVWSAKALLLGVLIGGGVCLLSPARTPDQMWFIFLCGAVSICAMILPGLSGSFVLMLMGKYEYIVTTVVADLFKDFLHNMYVMIVFMAGALVGIISFSHLLSWLLKRFYSVSICLLSGFMIGSLVRVWPWQLALYNGTCRPVAPIGGAGEILWALLWAAVGFALVFVLEIFAASKK
ncbi:MAG: DUF368 domain-containing protein [Bacteroidales bacterium]|nr:DUF368 domain-containing protein [Bacteroidales bacterium]